MEDFATKDQKGIKEKSMYILHLDTPRIIILSSVLIGLIITAALIGMNMHKLDQKDNSGLPHDSAVMDNLAIENGEKSTVDSTAEPPLNSDNILKNKENDNTITGMDSSIKPKDSMFASQGADNVSNTAVKESAADVLSHENIETIIPPAHVIKKSTQKNSVNAADKTNKKHSDKIKNSSKRKDVVEVSSKEKIFHAPDDKNYFSIQVAAFDKKSKALSEKNNLEGKKYNSYIDNAKVGGKTFYRVMIGPINSKKKAIDLLEEISADKRYEESYIIKR
ncbi:MAG: SPOR domain-containing protein [Spirochaetota bacterium]